MGEGQDTIRLAEWADPVQTELKNQVCSRPVPSLILHASVGLVNSRKFRLRSKSSVGYVYLAIAIAFYLFGIIGMALIVAVVVIISALSRTTGH
ncbi:hypothetical protein [Halochromatium salexigens]|nr:hypothetical protein [Halochromatium salexigens]